ncbi:MAG TPA: cyclopropane-fatty-acyl-phospholipid synthase family protein [Burkholderiaceae bacterium]|nr:cyclopropane-fatty-acyl-phospholipid synthase family protein [Burkholderiaceae bacterium]
MPSLIAQEMRRLAALTRIPFAVLFADGTRFDSSQGPPAFTLVFHTVGAELATATFGHVGLLDAYFDGEVDIDGDPRAMFRLGSESKFGDENPLVVARNHWHERAHSNASRERARENARFHYGLGTSFYRLWLDEPRMMYTCAYWKDGTRTLEQAQANKIDHVCRKARLAPGESVVDVGCGFGGFMFDAAARHGVRVTGVNTTTEQVEWLDAEIRARGLADRLSVTQADFRDIPGEFDKVVSIGVLEHAGRDQLADVVNAHARALKPGGLGVLHFIGHVGRRDTEFFIRDHVFPGGWIPSLAETIVAMEDAGLEVIDVENLRRHYALTLDVWAERFERNWPRIHELDPERFNERFHRIWRTYLIGCAEMFRSPAERTHLFQIVFSKGNVSSTGYPMSRAFLYADDIAADAATP